MQLNITFFFLILCDKNIYQNVTSTIIYYENILKIEIKRKKMMKIENKNKICNFLFFLPSSTRSSTRAELLSYFIDFVLSI